MEHIQRHRVDPFKWFKDADEENGRVEIDQSTRFEEASLCLEVGSMVPQTQPGHESGSMLLKARRYRLFGTNMIRRRRPQRIQGKSEAITSNRLYMPTTDAMSF